MSAQKMAFRPIAICSLALVLGLSAASSAWSQAGLKKVRLALPSKNVTFVPMFAAARKGFYEQEGLDVEIAMIRANLASSALMTGDIDYNGAVTGVIGGIVKGQPLKVVFFASTSPMMSMIGGKGITNKTQVKGKRIATSSPGEPPR